MTASGVGFAGRKVGTGHGIAWRAQDSNFPSGGGQRKKEIVKKTGRCQTRVTGHKKVLKDKTE